MAQSGTNTTADTLKARFQYPAQPGAKKPAKAKATPKGKAKKK